MHRLKVIDDSNQLAEQLYRAVLSRPADPQEVQNVSDYLASRSEQRDAAIKELVWGLMSSLEFRFNR